MGDIIIVDKKTNEVVIAQPVATDVVVSSAIKKDVSVMTPNRVVVVIGTSNVGSTDVDTAAILSQVQSQLDSRVAATIKPVSDKVAEHTQQIADLAEAVGDGCKKEWITLTEYKARLAAGTLEDDMTYLIENVNQDDEAL